MYYKPDCASPSTENISSSSSSICPSSIGSTKLRQVTDSISRYFTFILFLFLFVEKKRGEKSLDTLRKGDVAWVSSWLQSWIWVHCSIWGPRYSWVGVATWASTTSSSFLSRGPSRALFRAPFRVLFLCPYRIRARAHDLFRALCRVQISLTSLGSRLCSQTL